MFHSQQAAEKALKAFLTHSQIAFRKTQDLTDLGSQCALVDPTLYCGPLQNVVTAISEWRVIRTEQANQRR